MPPAAESLQDVLVASVGDVRPIAIMLRALSFRPRATVAVHDHGIKITVEEGHSLQANAYLHSTSFSTYTFSPDRTPRRQPPGTQESDDAEDDLPFFVFGISLATMLECLNIFGNAMPIGGSSAWTEKGTSTNDKGANTNGTTNRRGNQDEQQQNQRLSTRDEGKTTSLRMSYAGEGEPLILLLEEAGTVTRCEITTYEPDYLMDLPFQDEARVQKLIMKSEWLRDAFLEIDPSAEKLTIMFSPENYDSMRQDADREDSSELAPTFRLEAFGNLGSTEMDFPNERDVLETFECVQELRNTYKFSHIQLTLKALLASTKTSIRTGEDGLISFQFMIPLSRPKGGELKTGFVEFLVSSVGYSF